MRVLFRDQCLDEVEMPTMPLRHSSRAAREVQPGSVGENPGECHQDHRPRVEEKGKSPETRMQKSENCERRLNSICGSREWERGRERKVNWREERAVLAKT